MMDKGLMVDKIKGTIYGQAVGDALGLATEGMTDEDMAWKYPNGITMSSPKASRFFFDVRREITVQPSIAMGVSVIVSSVKKL